MPSRCPSRSWPSGEISPRGILRSQRGVKGGYSFGRAPEQITVLEIVEQLDGPLGVDATGVFADAAKAAQGVLAGRSIADIAEAELQSSGSQMYFI